MRGLGCVSGASRLCVLGKRGGEMHPGTGMRGKRLSGLVRGEMHFDD